MEALNRRVASSMVSLPWQLRLTASTSENTIDNSRPIAAFSTISDIPCRAMSADRFSTRLKAMATTSTTRPMTSAIKIASQSSLLPILVCAGNMLDVQGV